MVLNVVVVLLTLLLCIWEVLVSNLSLGINYSDVDFSQFSSVPLGNAGIVP
jgi:hypothetical protein